MSTPKLDARTRSKRAMNTHWQIAKSIAEAKASGRHVPISREDELAAIEQYLAERGATKCVEVDAVHEPSPGFPTRSSAMPGWR